jgi:hypothetical protein
VTNVITLPSSSFGALLAAGTTDPNTMYIISGSNLSAGTSGTSGTNGTNGITPSIGFASGSTNIGTATYIQFSGSAVQALTITSNTASITLVGGSGTGVGFPFSGSAQITGSLGVTGSMTIVSGAFSSSVVTNLGDIYTDVPAATKIVTISSASYATLTPKDPNTLYVVSGSSQGLQSVFPFTGSAIISGSIIVTGSALGNVVSASIVSTTASIDGNAGNFFTCLVTASTFFNVTNIGAGETVSIQLQTVQGNGNAAVPTASFSSNVLQPSGSRYTPSSGSGAIDVLSIVAFNSTNALLVSAKKFI